LGKEATLTQLIQQLCEGDLRLKAPSLTSASKTLYMQKPPALEKATRSNLDKPVSSLITSGEEITVTDALLESINLALSITFV
jgi:ubiquitin-activating enzyme E1 C